MAFRFPLAPLFRLRQSIERQRAISLLEANVAVSRMEDSLRQLSGFLANSAESDQASLGAGRRGAEIQFAAHVRERLRELETMLRAELVELQRKRQAAAAGYQHAYREREALEILRARQQNKYRQEQARREQRELDATHLLQLWRNRIG